PTTYLVDTTLSNSSDSDQTVQAVRLQKSGSVTFSAAPASLTGARPAPGQFTATATITVEIVR
ncbi:fimbrial protein, partial [Escherichia coli]